MYNELALNAALLGSSASIKKEKLIKRQVISVSFQAFCIARPFALNESYALGKLCNLTKKLLKMYCESVIQAVLFPSIEMPHLISYNFGA